MLSEAVFILSHISLLLLWKSFLHKPMCKCRSSCRVQRLKVCVSQTIRCALFLCSLAAAGGQGERTISLCNESTPNKGLWRALAVPDSHREALAAAKQGLVAQLTRSGCHRWDGIQTQEVQSIIHSIFKYLRGGKQVTMHHHGYTADSILPSL